MTQTPSSNVLDEIRQGLASGRVIPYLGPGALALAPDCPVPSTPEDVVRRLTAKVSVPHKIRNNLTAAAQFVENFKHRKTLVGVMQEVFGKTVRPSALHEYLAALPALPLVVNAWYDDAMQNALRGRSNWGLVQGVTQAEQTNGAWVRYFHADGSPADASDVQGWATVLYHPLGCLLPAKNFLMSDSDLVEVLTEIDIQTPIPPVVQGLRTGRHFLFLGCRFNTQLERIFARQITKRSSDRHWAVLPDEPTRNEARFLKEQGIQRLDRPLADFVAALLNAGPPHAQPLAVNV